MVNLTGFSEAKKPKKEGLLNAVYEGHGGFWINIKRSFPKQITEDMKLHGNAKFTVVGSSDTGAVVTLIREDFSRKESPETPYNLDTYYIHPKTQEWQKMSAEQQGSLHKAGTEIEALGNAISLNRKVLEIKPKNSIFKTLKLL